MSVQRPSWFPDSLQQDLIKACIFGDVAPERLPEFVAAGEDEPGIRHLFPLLYHQLNQHGIDHPYPHPLMDTLKKHRQQTWFANQQLMHRSASVLQLLNEHSIQTMFLKGAALLLTCYDSYSLRPMSDVDVLVPDEDAMRAYDLLASHGWHMTEADRAPKSRFRLIPGINLEDHTGNAFDLHWFAIWQNCRPGADSQFWRRALLKEIDDTPVHVPCPEDNLLHTLIHGARWNAVAPIRWVTDSLAILQRTPDFDWQTLVEEARRRRLSDSVVGMLVYLRSEFDAPIPIEPVQWLRQVGASPGQRLEHAMRHRQRGEWRGVKFHAYNLVRLNRSGIFIGPLQYIRAWLGRPLHKT